MKRLLTCLLIFLSLSSNAQSGLTDGSGYAPNFATTDLSGNSHDLYNYLDSGYVVVLEFLSVTCGHCMMHAAGTENSYLTNGPSGNNSAKFLALEVNGSTDSTAVVNFAINYNVTFPIANDISPTFIDYEMNYTPTYYVIYPDRSYTTICANCVTTTSSSTIEGLLDNAIASWPPVYGCTDATAINYDSTATSDDGSCTFTSYIIKTHGMTFSPDTVLCNVGDTINFILGQSHNAVEVDQSTFLSGGNTSNGGFSFGYGSSGMYIPASSQTFYYVCQPHVSAAMVGVIIANINGCTDIAAVNYDATATVDDGSCTYCLFNQVSLNLFDSWGDGWSGAIMTVNGIDYTLLSGAVDSFDLCIDMSGCTDLIYTPGSFFSNIENSWNVTDASGAILASGLYASGQLGNGCAVYGCTDSTATNYDPLATTDDGSCVYACAEDAPSNIYSTNVINDRATITWDNMNNSNCMVDQYRIRYREVGTSAWLSKTMAGSGLCIFGLNTTSKTLLGLTASTTYEYYMKAWYCAGSTSSWSTLQNFTTLDICLNVDNFAASTPTTTKAKFTWTLPATAYSFARIKLRVDTVGSTWTTAGGFGVFYPAVTKNKNGLNPGTTYRSSVRTWCDPAGGAYRSDAWTAPIFWTQPTSIRLEGGSAINNLSIFPNPSRDIFNVRFTSIDKQDLRVRILNIIGEELVSENLEQFIGEYTKQIDLTKNAKGIYFLEIEANEGIINKKLILQ